MEAAVENGKPESEKTGMKLYTDSSNIKLARRLAGQIEEDFKRLVFQPVHLVTA